MRQGNRVAGEAQSLFSLVGRTPLLHLQRLPPPGGAHLLAKWEGQNPSGSVKDRIVRAILEEAEARGLLRPGGTIVEASAGNTALSLALLGTARGYKVLVVMPESSPPERRRCLSALGAQVHLTPAREGMKGAQRLARSLAEEHGYFLLRQFENPANPRAHRETTAREILEATGGKVDAFVAGVGTGGTLTGVGEVLKREVPSALVVAVEPLRSPLLSQGKAGEHHIPGLGPDFLPPILNRSLIDEVVAVSDEEALEMMVRLAQAEGVLAGVSSGANLTAALQVARRLGPGKTVVTILPDRGERYLST